MRYKQQEEMRWKENELGRCFKLGSFADGDAIQKLKSENFGSDTM